MIKQRAIIKIIRDDLQEFRIDGSNWALTNNGLENFGEYESDITITDNAVGDGGIYSSYRMASKDRTITCKSLYISLNSILRKQAISFFNSKNTYKIYITYNEETRWCEGMVAKFMLPTTNLDKMPMTLTVTFMCANPFLKSENDFGRDIASVRATAGFPYCSTRVIGHPTGVFNFAQKVILENDGDVETYCRAVFVADGDVTNPKLIIGNDYVRVLDTMTVGDTLVMDFTANPPTVKKNGVNWIGHCDRTSAFDAMVLGIGDTEVQFDADNGSNLLQVSIYYNKLYTTI